MKLICGPMATISHPAFRILIEKFGGCDEYFTEMINAGTLLTNGQFEKYYIDPHPVPEKVVWQLTGHDCFHMKDAAAMLLDLPGIGIDLNMGCSAPDIYRYGAGIGWMLKPVSETMQMVRSVAEEVKKHNEVSGEKKRLSVKLRLGDDNFTEEVFFDFCDKLVENGAELLTLHPRTKKEKLVRPPRYIYCEKLALRYKNKIPVYLNGNVKDADSACAAIKVCPNVSGIMISRAAVQKPWIFKLLDSSLNKKQIEAFDVDLKQLAFDYISDVEVFQPKEFWKTRLQRFFTYYANNFKFSHYAQTQFINASDNDDLRARISDFFEKCPEEKILRVGF